MKNTPDDPYEKTVRVLNAQLKAQLETRNRAYRHAKYPALKFWEQVQMQLEERPGVTSITRKRKG